MQIRTYDLWDKGTKWSVLGVRRLKLRSEETKVRFGGLTEASLFRSSQFSCENLAPSHASYHGPEHVWATGYLMSPVRGFGTSCLLHCTHLTVSAQSEDS